jgi:ribosomal protein S18 acetylase RimI-like enzyme
MTGVRAMDEADIDAFLALANATGWSYEAADAERLMRLFPDGCFACEDDGLAKGFATALSFGKVGVIGNVVVEKMYRRRGAGAALVRACIDHLASAGATDTRLYAYEDVVRFYERLGFAAGRGYLTMRGAGGAVCRGHAAVRADDLLAKRIVAMDENVFGSGRGRLLKSLRGEFPDMALASVDGDELEGYLFARGSEDTGYEAGPWVAAADGGMALLDALVGMVEEGADVWVTVPEDSDAARDAAGRLGFKRMFRTVEMALGKPPVRRDERLLALCGLEKG